MSFGQRTVRTLDDTPTKAVSHTLPLPFSYCGAKVNLTERLQKVRHIDRFGGAAISGTVIDYKCLELKFQCRLFVSKRLT